MKILIIRLSAIGDIVMASGMIKCLKKKFKRVYIDWLVQSEYEELLSSTKLINKLLVWDRRKWNFKLKKGSFIRFYKELATFLKDLRSTNYDLVLDLQGLIKSGVWALISRGKKKIVLDPKEHTHIFFKDVVITPKSKEISSEYKFLLAELNAYEGEYELGIDVSLKDMERAKSLLKNFGVKEKEYVVFAPFTTRLQKKWPDEFWLDLSKKVEGPVVVLGGKEDQKDAKNMEKASSNIINLTGKTRIRESMYIVKRAKLLIGVDTGLTHMGMLSHIPTIAIFGATCPYLEVDNPKGVVIYNKLSCSPCKRSPVCNGSFVCMRSITPRTVELVYRELTNKK